MQDFNSFTRNNASNESGLNPNLLNLITSMTKKYNNASEEELLKAIYKEAEKGRKQKTLKDSDLDAFQNMLLPMLDAKKGAKLKAVINKLKKID